MIKKNLKKRRLSALNVTLIVGFLVLVGLVVFSLDGGITGYAITGVSDRINLEDIELVGDQQFKVIEVSKNVNSMLNLYIKSEFKSNILVEIDDCGYWRTGKDRNDQVLYSIDNIKKGNFNIGDPRLNTAEQKQFYKSNYLCLIIFNEEFQSGNYGKIELRIDQLNKDRWNV